MSRNSGKLKLSPETGEKCLKTGEQDLRENEKCIETRENEKCLEAGENYKCLETGKKRIKKLKNRRNYM